MSIDEVGLNKEIHALKETLGRMKRWEVTDAFRELEKMERQTTAELAAFMAVLPRKK